MYKKIKEYMNIDIYFLSVIFFLNLHSQIIFTSIIYLL